MDSKHLSIDGSKANRDANGYQPGSQLRREYNITCIIIKMPIYSQRRILPEPLERLGDRQTGTQQS